MVIGSKNNLKGSNHWIFDSEVSSKNLEDGVLIIERYLIEIVDV